jgi:shikimate dehydrogenase
MKKYGLTGYPLSHSFSKIYFADKFVREGITGCAYENFPLQSIDELPALLRSQPLLCGLNVTIPHKQQVIAFLDEADAVVQAIGACNCIRIRNGLLQGFNTDVIGFEKSFARHLKPHHTHALILGTGGAAKAVEYVLQKLGITYKNVTRQKTSDAQLQYDELNQPLLLQYTVIINTTPLGMSPHTEESPAIPYTFITPQHYLFDLIYNPAETKFLQQGKAQGAITENGYDMLIIQAEESWRIWNEAESR